MSPRAGIVCQVRGALPAPRSDGHVLASRERGAGQSTSTLARSTLTPRPLPPHPRPHAACPPPRSSPASIPPPPPPRSSPPASPSVNPSPSSSAPTAAARAPSSAPSPPSSAYDGRPVASVQVRRGRQHERPRRGRSLVTALGAARAGRAAIEPAACRAETMPHVRAEVGALSGRVERVRGWFRCVGGMGHGRAAHRLPRRYRVPRAADLRGASVGATDACPGDNEPAPAVRPQQSRGLRRTPKP